MKKIASFYKASTMLAMAIASAFVFTGCATIVRGTKDVLVVDSQPSNAHIRLSNGMTGVTPASFKIARDSSITCTIEKEGYYPASIFVTNHAARAGVIGCAGNIVSWGIIGAGVDIVSGATQELTPNPVFVQLEPCANSCNWR